MKYWVYVHINRINGKKYVGTTHQNDPKTRWVNGRGYSTQPHFKRAIEKYDWKNFDHCYVECRSEEEMFRLEQYYIEKYQTTNPEFGYNKSLGGEKSNWQGKDSRSKEYNNKFYNQNKGYYKEYYKEYYQQNKEKIKEHNSKYNKNNPHTRGSQRGYQGEYYKEYYQQNKEKIKEHNSKYNKEHQKDLKEYRKAYNQQNKEKRKEYNRQNKEQILEYQKEYYQQHKEKIKAYQKEYYQRKKQQQI